MEFLLNWELFIRNAVVAREGSSNCQSTVWQRSWP